MAVTRIKNNQITDSTIVASSKLQDYSITAGKIANNLTYGSDLTVTGNLVVNGNVTNIDTYNLQVEDPIIILASNQTGAPALDIGFLGERGNSTNIAFVWKESQGEFVTAFTSDVVTNTTVTINSYASFRTLDASVTGNLAVTGTTAFTGNVTGNLNVTGNVAGGNFLTVGLISATSNITGGNILTGGQVSATGNGTFGNISTSGSFSVANISASGNITGGNLITGGLLTATGNIDGGNLNTAGLVSATGNVIGGNLTTAGLLSSATISATGNANVGNLGTAGLITVTGNIDGGNINTAGLVSATGNVGGGNINTGGLVAATGNITGGNLITGGVLSATGNANVGNLGTAGLITATGNITSTANVTGGNLVTAGLATVTGNIDGGNINTAGLVSATGNVIGGNVSTAGQVTATANITGGNLITGGVLSATGNANVGNLGTAGLITATGNINGGNLITSGLVQGTTVSATGNVIAGNVNTNNVVGTGVTITSTGNLNFSPTGNIVLNNKYINGVSQPVQDNDAASKIYVDNMVSTQLAYHQAVVAATTGNLAAATAGNITYNNGTAGVGATLTTTGSFNLIDTANVQTANTRILVKDEANAALNGVYEYTSSTVITRTSDADTYGPNSATDLSINDYFFVTSGSVNAGSAWIVDAPSGTITFGTSNITFAQFSSSQTYTAGNGIAINATVISAKTDNNTTAFDAGGNIIVKASANLTTPNIGAATGTSVSVTGNVDGGNINTGGLVTATGNVGGGNINTGGLITATGNANVGNLGTAGLITATGNVDGGNLNTAGLVTATGNVGGGNINTGGLVAATGNITGGNLITGGLVTATGNITSTANITGGNLITGGTLSATGNANVGNLGTAGLITATGNIGGGNINTGGLVTATGNISSGANIVATANVIGGNISTAGLVTATGNITGGNLITGGILSVTGNANVGNLGTAGLITATGNVDGGNLNTAGLVTATGNITGGNISTGGLITATGNITATANIAGGNISTGGLITATGNITGGNITTAGIASLGNLRISENTINGASGYVFINAIQQDVDFAVNGDTASNIFYVDGGTGTASFGSATQTTNAIVAFNSNKSILMPVGTTGERPGSGVTGMVRFNTSVNNLEFYDANSWQTAGSQFTVIVANTQVGNGVEVAFTLPGNSTTAGTIVAINGVVQIPTTAYSVSGNVCTFTEAPESTDYIDFRVLTTTSSVSALASSTGALVEASASAIELDFTGNVVPTANLTYSLGNSTNFWKSLYVGGNSIYLGSLILKDAGSNTFAVYTSDGTTQANLDVGTIDVSAINSGTSTIGISGTNGNAYITVGGIANVLVASTTGANVTGTLGVSGNITAGNLSGTSIVGTLTTAAQTNITSVGTLTALAVTGNITSGNVQGTLISGTTVSVTGNVTGGNLITAGIISATGNITGSYILGNGSQLTGIDATSIQSGTSNVKVVSSGGNVTTSVGGTSNVLVVTSTGANIAGTLSASGNITAGNLSGTSIVGTLTTAAQTNITSVGTLGSLAVSGNITPGGIAMSTGNATIGNLYVSGTTTIAGNITQVSGNSGQFFGNSSTGFNALYAGLPAGFTLLPQSVVNFVSQFDSYSQINNQNQSAGNTATTDYVLTSDNGNDSTYYVDFGIASSTYDGAVAILNNAMGNSVTPNDAYLYTTGNVAAGNPSDLVFGAVDIGGQIRFAVAGSTVANVAMKLNAPNTTSSSTTTGTAVITGGVGVSGNITSGNLSVGTGTVTLGTIVNANGNGVGNIGSSSLYFNTVFAKATSAQYADLAEMYVADADYTPGTVVSFGGEHEVTVSGVNSDKRIAGVISTNPSYVMNATQSGDHVVAVALTGRVPTRVTGAVAKGDMMVSNGDGTARAESNPQVGSVIGKALENFAGESGIIEVVVGRL